jgi:hypothetical protein
MAKRRTSGIQRRERASAEALGRRLDERRASALPDWRLLLIGGVVVVGVLILGLVIIFGSGPDANAGTQHPDDGTSHVAVGTTCRSPEAPCGADPYSSIPGTSGPHWDPSGIASWGVYSTPQNESQVIHNLEHGGIVIWYDPEALEADGIDALTRYVDAQVASGLSGRYKFIVSPWGGIDPLPSPVVATAWRYSLELETADTDAIDAFARARYGRSPEPNGGPAPPG